MELESSHRLSPHLFILRK